MHNYGFSTPDKRNRNIKENIYLLISRKHSPTCNWDFHKPNVSNEVKYAAYKLAQSIEQIKKNQDDTCKKLLPKYTDDDDDDDDDDEDNGMGCSAFARKRQLEFAYLDSIGFGDRDSGDENETSGDIKPKDGIKQTAQPKDSEPSQVNKKHKGNESKTDESHTSSRSSPFINTPRVEDGTKSSPVTESFDELLNEDDGIFLSPELNFI